MRPIVKIFHEQKDIWHSCVFELVTDDLATCARGGTAWNSSRETATAVACGLAKIKMKDVGLEEDTIRLATFIDGATGAPI